MRTIQTEVRFPLDSVKPLEGLQAYRSACLEAVTSAMKTGTRRRQISPVTGSRLEPLGRIGGLDYGRCPETGSAFLLEIPEPSIWAQLLSEVNGFRQSPNAIHQTLADSRTDYVHLPKLEWIQSTLRLQEVVAPRFAEIATPPSELQALLQESGTFASVLLEDEMKLAHTQEVATKGDLWDAAILPESLDRVDDPAALLSQVRQRLVEGGLLFVTALVFSGYDMAVLGSKNLYLYPPDRTNCLTLRGLQELLQQSNFKLLEVSTPGALDLEIVRAHRQVDPALPLSGFDRQLADADSVTREAFQSFLQNQGLSSFARIVAKKEAI